MQKFPSFLEKFYTKIQNISFFLFFKKELYFSGISYIQSWKSIFDLINSVKKLQITWIR